MNSMDQAIAKTNRLVELYLSISDRLGSILWKVCVGLLAILTLLVFGRVIGRYIFDYAPQWAPEISRYLAIWLALLLIGLLVKEDNHLKVTIAYNKFSPQHKKYLYLGNLVIVLVFSSLFTYWGYVFAVTRGFRSVTPALRVDFFYMYMILPISGALLIFFTIGRILEVIQEDASLDKGIAAEADYSANNNQTDKVSDPEQTRHN